MMNDEQRERLLGNVASGIELETAREALGISEIDLQVRLLCDEGFVISLALAEGMRTEFAKALFVELVSN